MPGCLPCRPPTVGVHPTMSTHPGPSSGARLSSRPVSARPVSGHLVPSSGIQLSSRLVSARRPVASVSPHISPAVALEDQVGAAGQPSRLEPVEFQVGCRSPNGSVHGPRRPGRSQVMGRSGVSAADLAGSRSGRAAATPRPLTEQRARPARGRPVAGAAPRHRAGYSATLLHLPRGRRAGLDARLLSVVVVVGPDARVDRPGRANKSYDEDGRTAPTATRGTTTHAVAGRCADAASPADRPAWEGVERAAAPPPHVVERSLA
jgi:hypothetical protein